MGFQPKWVEPNRKLLLNLKLICLDQKLPYSFDHKSNSSAVEDFPSSPHIDTFYSDDTRICKKHIIHTGYSFHPSIQISPRVLVQWDIFQTSRTNRASECRTVALAKHVCSNSAGGFHCAEFQHTRLSLLHAWDCLCKCFKLKGLSKKADVKEELSIQQDKWLCKRMFW